MKILFRIFDNLSFVKMLIVCLTSTDNQCFGAKQNKTNKQTNKTKKNTHTFTSVISIYMTCETSQVLLAGVPGGFSRGSPVFAHLLIGPSHMS